MQVTRARATAVAHALARDRSRSTGFSQNMALPAATARKSKSAWVSVLDAINTAPMAGSASAVSMAATCAPYRAANSCPACAFTSLTYLSRTPGSRTRFPAWILPIRPAPKTATSIILILLGRDLRSVLRPGLAQHPLVLGIIAEHPGATRSGHHIQIVEIIAVCGTHRMVSAGHQHEVAVVHAHRLIEITIVRVHALERETLGRIDSMVVGF